MIKPNSSTSDYAHIVSSEAIFVKPKQATRGKKKRPKKLMDQVRDAIRLEHDSIRTEQAYVGWIRRCILFHDVRHPAEMGAAQVEAFWTHLAVKANAEPVLPAPTHTHRPCVVAAKLRERWVWSAWICPLQGSVVYCFCRFSVVGLRRSQGR